MLARLVRRAGAFALLGAVAAPAESQTVITGTVRGERAAPLTGAYVTVAGTSSGVPTSDSGRYRLVVPARVADASDSVTVVARRIGFQPQSRRVALRNRSVSVDFSLVPATVALSGVVVTGAVTATPERVAGSATERTRAATAPAAEARPADSRSAKAAASDRASVARSDGGRVERGAARRQEPSAGVLTAAVWEDAAHWPEYLRFLRRADERSWNPWGLDVGQATVRPASDVRRQRSSRRALDLGFLVDATGSMGDEMMFLQTELADIVRRVRAAEPGLDVRLSVVFYRDRGDAFVTRALPFTRSADSAVAFIAGTRAEGGGDYPEDMNAGLEAMMRQRWSRDAVPQMLFLLADAPPKQYAGADYTYHEAIQDAATGGIAIYPVAASGVDKPTEFLFRTMAVMTGGKYVFLTDDSGVGDHHEEPDISGYTVEKLNDLMVREIRSFVTGRGAGQRVAEAR